MKREDLKALGLADDAIDNIMALHGKDIEAHKTKVLASESQINTLTAQVSEANKQIEGFKSLDVDSIKKAADEWKTKATQAEQTAAAQLQALKFDHALESALAGAKVKNTKAVQALLSKDALKFNEADGSIIGLKEQIEKIKSENDYLFADEKPVPKIVAGGKSQTVLDDPVIIAMRNAAGLPTK